MPMKVTMQFNIARASFTEAHYSRIYSDPNASGAVTAALRLAALRIQLLGAGCYLARLRLSRTDVPRVINNVSLLGVVTATDAFTTGDITEDADIPNVSVVANANDGAGHSKNLYLAGLPENCVELAGGSAPYFRFVGTLSAAWTAYTNELINNWNFRIKAPIGPAVQVINVFPAPSAPVPGITLVTLTELPSQPATTPFEVNVSGFRRNGTRTPGLSGAYSVETYNPVLGPPASFDYTLSGAGNVQAGNFIRLGKIAVLAYAYAPYVNMSISKGGTRKRGGSAGLPRGRSPIRG